MNLLTTAQVAEMYACSKQAISARARRKKIKPAIAAGRDYLWTPKQAHELAPGPSGRPKRA